ncbi:Asp-tRNA(Asn)/Glu-tRNA(Gln) amidotransferase subunit GatC [Halodesulfovibrio sp.]|jgi:aspartyl-tRNA(Asn)/glutamyl-tRNA(Gln) amidotransferase subunit C|uniref:Asp-tRNA(Asn)/Glu-tRNA(Gln) amidotransferase subunit GatC n=1 Tax=Halodesulfovibrio sp. TaxID=1912772 RepID=UPI0025E3137E|nr:Asp-tRNA(Asn)/Glu-tRNA(Gln) amidotransferase subunit GatC [Halodesulfovibrio sp.]MCT4534548.1 Asp-tRNA(Asn)/Glu-tRNA(Gln) amidotransferase subunit GatC [Halodesulfovibrio sp.]MCT4626046.1 Asp-tRNA(Asn)/Glu-tRNA(Gln) amidotransferase subunit GatC [Halodesulfovibrio sp.]
MSITPERVAQIAKLARLELDDEKQRLFAGQFEDILKYMDTLNELDTAGTEPLYSPVEQPTPLREDKVEKDFTREEIVSNAPETDGKFFIVPKIV